MLLENWTRLAHPWRHGMLAAAALAGIIAVYNWIVKPHTNYLMATQKYEFVTDNLAKKNHAIGNNVTAKKKELKALQEEFRQSRTKLFDPNEARAFFNNIQMVSEEANCVIHSLKFSASDSALKAKKPRSGSYITAKRATLSFAGGYSNIVALMNKLQDRLKQVRISSVSIEPTRDAAQLKCNLTITVYVIQDKEKLSNG